MEPLAASNQLPKPIALIDTPSSPKEHPAVMAAINELSRGDYGRGSGRSVRAIRSSQKAFGKGGTNEDHDKAYGHNLTAIDIHHRIGNHKLSQLHGDLAARHAMHLDYCIVPKMLYPSGLSEYGKKQFGPVE